MLPEGLKSHEAEGNKCLLVVLALRYQGPSLVSGSEGEDAAYGQGCLELNALFYLSCLKVFFLLSTSMRSKHWSMQNEKRLKLFYESHVNLSLFSQLPSLTKWCEAGFPLQASMRFKSKAVFDGSPCVSQKAENLVRSSLTQGEEGCPATPSYWIHLVVFICTKFSATSSPKAWALRPSWWCHAEIVLELCYSFAHIHTYLCSLSCTSLFCTFLMPAFSHPLPTSTLWGWVKCCISVTFQYL